jgi:predicted secreted protein
MTAATGFCIRKYDHDGVLLNLYGTRDEDGCDIEIVTAADSAINLIELFHRNTLLSMGEIADAQLEREAKQGRDEARAERAAHSRAMAY